MTYKVEFYTLSKMKDGSIGNCIQNRGVCYTELSISEIQIKLNEHLVKKNQISVIEKIQTITGFIL